MRVYLLIALLISLVIAILAVQNPEAVSIRFLFWVMPQTSLVAVILGSAVGGGLIVLTFDLMRFWKMASRLKQYAQENQQLKDRLGTSVEEVKEAQPTQSNP